MFVAAKNLDMWIHLSEWRAYTHAPLHPFHPALSVLGGKKREREICSTGGKQWPCSLIQLTVSKTWPMNWVNCKVCAGCIRLGSLCIVVCACGWSVHFYLGCFAFVLVCERGQHFFLFVSDTLCAEGVENLSVGLSRIYFKPFYVVPGRFCFI